MGLLAFGDKFSAEIEVFFALCVFIVFEWLA